MTTNLDTVRSFWKCAGTFPPNKEEVYPDHAAAQGFDEHPAGRRVLEYGCGGGSDAMSWARRGHVVWYCDVVPENLEITKKRFAEYSKTVLSGLPWWLRTSDDLPFGDGEIFDVIASHGVLHHVEDPLPILRAMRRVIKPSGRLVVMLYSPKLRESFEEMVQQLMRDKGISEAEAFGWCTDGPGCPHARSYSVDEARDLLREAGFRLLETRSSHGDLFLTHHAVPA